MYLKDLNYTYERINQPTLTINLKSYKNSKKFTIMLKLQSLSIQTLIYKSYLYLNGKCWPNLEKFEWERVFLRIQTLLIKFQIDTLNYSKSIVHITII